MDKRVKEIIEKNIAQIEANDFGPIYTDMRLNNIFPIDLIPVFTQTLLKAGIDPLKYLNYVPNLYLAKTPITSIDIPNNIIEIKNNAFLYCANLTQVKFSDKLEKIDNSAFCGTEINNVKLPNTLTRIGDEAFSGNPVMSEFIMPDSVTEIGNGLFSLDTKLETVHLSNTLKEIPRFTFLHCSGLKTIQIPESVTFIGRAAFSNCSSLKSIFIPESISREMLRDAGIDETQTWIMRV